MSSATDACDVLEGPVLDVLPVLLAEGRTEEVILAVRALVARNEELEKRLAALGQRGGKSNEGVSTKQLQLLLDQLEASVAPPIEGEDLVERPHVDERLLARAGAAAERARAKVLAEAHEPKRQPLKKPLPEHLPRVDEVLDVPEGERGCPECGAERVECGREVSEVLEFEPAKLYMRRQVRVKRACRDCDGQIVRAPRGDKIVRGGQLGCGLVAQLLYAKYSQGVPLHRQRKDFARLGAKLSSSTLCDQVKWAAELLRPLWLEAVDQVIDADVMHIDGTGIRVLDRDHASGKRLGTLWATVGANADGPVVAAYHYASTKKAKGQRPGELGPTDILSLRTGITVSDADTLFAAQMKRDDVTDCGCNMHARRYFVKALDGGDERAAPMLGAFKGLYQVEEDVRDAPADKRLKARSNESTPIYDDMVAWCHHHVVDLPPASPLGRAVRYMLHHEEALRRFEHDGRIPIDNAAAEHAFVPVALTRKNYLFFGADSGGDRAAVIYTMLRCCQLANVDPVEYLRDVLSTLCHKLRRIDVPELMPARWKLRAQLA
jgi:transposase